MADTTVILETHLYSNPLSGVSPPWSRSFHLRLPIPIATKADILLLVRASVARLGRADPVVESQITLYFTRNGRVVSLPGSPSAASNTIGLLPVYQPPQIINLNIPHTTVLQQQQQQQGSPDWPLAITYANGINYLHSYGPSPPQITATTTTTTTAAAFAQGAHQMAIIGGGGFSLINVSVPSVNVPGGRPVVSDVVREERLDGIVEDALKGLLEWAVGPTGLKLIVTVDVDGRDVVPAVVTLPEPPAAPAPATSPPVSPPAAAAD